MSLCYEARENLIRCDDLFIRASHITYFIPNMDTLEINIHLINDDSFILKCINTEDLMKKTDILKGIYRVRS